MTDDPPTPAGDTAPESGRPGAGRGYDLAKAALEAARMRNAAGRKPGAARGAAARAGAKDAAAGRGRVAGRMARRRWSGPGADAARDPQRIGDTVTAWVKRTGGAKEIAKATLVTRWAQIVGSGIAQHCEPVSLVDGELLVQAESTAWATQLRMLAPQLVARINAEVGRGTVAKLRARGPAGPSWRFGNRHVSGRGPRDTYG